MSTILCLDDEPRIIAVLARLLRHMGHQALGAHTAAEALQHLASTEVDLILSDHQMPGLDGLDFLELLRSAGHEMPLIMMTGYSSIEHAVAAMRAGAVDYLPKPIRSEQLEIALGRALEVARVQRENRALRSQVDEARREVMAFRNERQIVGESAGIRRILQTVAMAAPTRATVLLQGESGTGKELFARALHDQSDRRERPFIKLNCAALPEGLIESALFGHEKGAFTGAIKRVEGAFERAHGGTLLLDEVSEMRLDLQAKLLRVLQEQEFERVGGTAPIRVDVRVIATTNRILAAEAQAGRFRPDLYYRLSTIPVAIPPLRERAEDIPLLAYRFALRTAQELGKHFEGLAPETMAMLQAAPWPGNVRELQHAVERAVILSRDPVLTPHAFDGTRFGLMSDDARRARFTRPAGPATPIVPGGSEEMGHVLKLPSLRLDEVERVVIARALEVTGQNQTRAAELLGVTARTLWNKKNRVKSTG